MSCSQLFSSFLCIGFLCSIANGFTTIFQPTVKIEFKTPIIAHRDPCPTHKQSRTDRRYTNLCATKGRSKAPAADIVSSSDKVKEMASFLSVQLLEKVMGEAMKPEGERTMDLEAIERITQALQTSSQPPLETPTPEATIDSSKADDSTSPSTEQTSKIEPEAIPEPILSAPSVITEIKPEDSSLSTTTAESDTTNIDSKKIESSETIPEKVVKEEKAPDPVPKTVSSTPKAPESIVKPLEVIQSNIPPLRPESIPQKITPTAVDEQQKETGTIEEEEAVGEISDVEETKEDNVEESASSEETGAHSSNTLYEEDESDPALFLERKKTEESFRRRLLQQKLKFDQKNVSRIKKEKEADSEPSTPTDETEEAKEETIKGESTTINNNDNIVSEPRESKTESPKQLTSKPVISERRVQTIVALRQPKTSDEETKLAEKYAQMTNLEDRAYALLVDLGMIDERKDPRDPSYDHSNDDGLCDQRFLPLL